MKSIILLLFFLVFGPGSFLIHAQRTDIQSVLLIGKNAEFVRELKEGEKVRLSKRDGWIEEDQFKSRMLNMGKQGKDKVKKIFMDDETGVIYVRFKKAGKLSIAELQIMGNSQNRSTIVGGVLDMVSVAGLSTSLILSEFVYTGTKQLIARVGAGVSGAGFIFFGIYAYMGDVYLLDLKNADVLYRIEDAKGYRVYRKYPQSTGTSSYPTITVR